MPFFASIPTLSVVIAGLQVRRPVVRPTEANTSWIVDPNAVPSGAAARQLFKPVARQGSKVSKGLDATQQDQTTRRHTMPLEIALRLSVLEAPNHAQGLYPMLRDP